MPPRACRAIATARWRPRGESRSTHRSPRRDLPGPDARRDRVAQLFRFFVRLAMRQGERGLLHGRDDLTRGAVRVFIAVQPNRSAQTAGSRTATTTRLAIVGMPRRRPRARRRHRESRLPVPRSSRLRVTVISALMSGDVTISGLNRGVHVGLNSANGERAVVEADFVDAPREESPQMLLPPIRSTPVEVSSGPATARLPTWTPLTYSRSVVPS